MLLVPASDDVTTGLEQAAGMRHGMYTEVAVGTVYVNISRKLAIQARRQMAERGNYQDTISSTPQTLSL